MSFTTVYFLFYCLPIFILIYYLLNPKFRNIYLLIVSLLFYLWGSASFLWLVGVSIVVNFGVGLILDKKRRDKRFQKTLLTVGIIFNVCVLGYFKYANFFLEQFNKLFTVIGMTGIHWQSVILPLGISFYTFLQISYLVDCYRGEKASRNLSDYALYVLLFPKFIAGPLMRWSQFFPQLKTRQESVEKFFDGIYRFTIGLAQKVIVANVLGELVGDIFIKGPIRLSMTETWLYVLAYTFQIYFDFVGYTNMGIGLGKVIGFEFPENFNLPYLSKSITDFWRRWHITLGAFLRDYLYIPLGGNRVSVARNILNFIIVFTIGGLWHGAGWHFIAWGLYFGVLLGIEKHFYKKYLERLPSFVQIALTFILVALSWVLFASDSLRVALRIFKNLFLPKANFYVVNFTDKRLLIFLALAFLFSFVQISKNSKVGKVLSSDIVKGLTIIILLILSAMMIAAGSFQAFIYEQF